MGKGLSALLDNQDSKKTLPEMIKMIMASKGLKATDVAEKKGCGTSALSQAINKPSMGIDTLHDILQAMDEDLTIKTSDGFEYTIKI